MSRDPRLFPKYHDLVGTPFCTGGRDPRTGLDCVGVMLWVLSQEGHDIPDPGGRRGIRNLTEFRRYFDRVDGPPRAYDVLYGPSGGDLSYVHTVLEGVRWVISAERAVGVVLVRLARVLEPPADNRLYRLSDRRSR